MSSFELTCAGLQTLKPLVCYFAVAGTSTLFEPSAARSAATGSAGFLEHAAFWARHRMSDRRGGS